MNKRRGSNFPHSPFLSPKLQTLNHEQATGVKLPPFLSPKLQTLNHEQVTGVKLPADLEGVESVAALEGPKP